VPAKLKLFFETPKLRQYSLIFFEVLSEKQGIAGLSPQ
jgi:hypothetical protein